MTAITWRAWRVWQRNLDVFLQLWKTEAWPPFVEPLLNLGALGFGLGAYVSTIEGQTYQQYIAPGIIASAILFAASFECLFGTFLRMQFQRTFDAIIATPVSIEEVVVGEILWGATRGLLAAIGVLVVVAALGLITTPWMLLALPIGLLAGFMFAAMATAYTSFAPSIDIFNYYITLGITPMFLFSGIFFPTDNLPPAVQNLIWLSPLYHVVRIFRALAASSFPVELWLHLVIILGIGLACSALAIRTLRRRLVV